MCSGGTTAGGTTVAVAVEVFTWPSGSKDFDEAVAVFTIIPDEAVTVTSMVNVAEALGARSPTFQVITVVPDGYQDNLNVLAKATTIIIKFGPGQLVPNKPGQEGTIMNWTVDNIVAYSKICTHVGCPVALYEQTTHHILCPCHQSTFDASTGATVIFGPAPRPLPQLPMTVDAQGFLVARSDFTQPVGPSFWERG